MELPLADQQQMLTVHVQVAADYTTRLDMGNQAVKSLITTIYKGIDSQSTASAQPLLVGNAHILLTGLAFTTAATRTAVKLFNPLGWTRKEVVRIPINSTSVKVMDAAGNLVPSQINPVPSYSIDKRTHSARCVESRQRPSWTSFRVSILQPLLHRSTAAS